MTAPDCPAPPASPPRPSYRDVLRYWCHNEYDSPINGGQLGSSKAFRLWQLDNRCIGDEEAEFTAYIESEKRSRARREESTVLPDLDDPEGLENERRYWKERRKWRQQNVRENTGVDGFAGYVDAVKRRLAAHGFFKPFRLEQDPSRQDRLTTWIEYLNYAYWWDDRNSARLAVLQPQHEEAWRELQKLHPAPGYHITEALLLSREEAEKRTRERLEAEKALENAKTQAKAVLELTKRDRDGPQPPRFSSEQRTAMVTEAHARYKEAKNALALIQTRNEAAARFRDQARDYALEKEKGDRHKTLIRWILDHIDAVEAEMKQVEKANERMDAPPRVVIIIIPTSSPSKPQSITRPLSPRQPSPKAIYPKPVPIPEPGDSPSRTLATSKGRSAPTPAQRPHRRPPPKSNSRIPRGGRALRSSLTNRTVFCGGGR
ncbi:cfadbe27-7b0f-4699-b994-95ec62f90d82 [Thermothielavioides terrestris]|uniref:Cfadbe27-7b0f-4699-b994-95ec62f90d82 n=1 Tax=Thermothielavioides terrestris TaxID=2587410 RepID=A0A446BSR4_9PEZI|nr:cfadbe27-7b0f-4699-b994-95ec62f90d82 [Thermothielavioides terrestris]